jgi:rod shape-determining protein MreB
MKINLGIDFGGSYVSIYKKGEGVIFKEPSLIAVKGSNSKYKITAIGNEAKNKQNKHNDVLVFSPFSEGLVKSVDYASLYLKNILLKLFKRVMFSKICCTLAIPCGTNLHQEKEYMQICSGLKINCLGTVRGAICSVISAKDNPHYPQLIVDIGGAKTDVAVVNGNSILHGATLGLGGTAMDNSIINAVEKKYDLIIDELTAEMIKNNIGSLYSNDTLNTEIIGIDIKTQTPRGCVVYSKEIRECLIPYFNEIVNVIKATFSEFSESELVPIVKNGILLTGGITGISGIEQFFSNKLGINATISEYADNSVILGLSKFV